MRSNDMSNTPTEELDARIIGFYHESEGIPDASDASPITFDRQDILDRYSLLLRTAGWFPNPAEMFKAPSIAKGSPGRRACEDIAKTSDALPGILSDFLLAARLEHLIAVGGPKARRFLFSAKCPLNAQQIAKLCRRMPPFIQAKLEGLYAVGKNIDSNPTGAFDTDGWGELRVRLPRFAHALAAFGNANESHLQTLTSDKIQKLREMCEAIIGECEQLESRIRSFSNPQSSLTIATIRGEKASDWTKAVVKFAQALGVLRKTNRDLRSVHWREEWVPTSDDFKIVIGSVQTMKAVAERLLDLRR